MTLSEIKEILRAHVILGEHKLDMIIKAGAGSDLMSDLLRGSKDGVVVLSGLNTVQVIRTAVIAGVAAVVLVRGKRPEQDMIALARTHDLPLLSTPFTMYTACGRLFRQGLRGVEQKSAE
ncbi:MAG: DRTGG domain-containing protein [Deltaproteobacteria bacterium]